jgi:hypothetical protein
MNVQSPRIFNGLLIVVFVAGVAWLSEASWNSFPPHMPGARIPDSPKVRTKVDPVSVIPPVEPAAASETAPPVDAQAADLAPQTPPEKESP